MTLNPALLSASLLLPVEIQHTTAHTCQNMCINVSGGVICSLPHFFFPLIGNCCLNYVKYLKHVNLLKIHVPNPVLVSSNPFQTDVCTVGKLLYKSV